MEALNTIQKLAVFIIPILFAITLHEAAHGWVASRCGDKTALMLGRVSANPFRHIDPVGTILVPLLTFFLSGFIFGWAKPVPITWRNLRNQRRDMALVSLAGPGANLLMALFWSILIQIGVMLLEGSQWIAVPLIYMAGAGVLINVILMVLNMLPILPLDGGRVMNTLLPARLSVGYSRLEPYGLFILLGLLLTGLLGRILWPLVVFVIDILPGSEIVRQIF